MTLTMKNKVSIALGRKTYNEAKQIRKIKEQLNKEIKYSKFLIAKAQANIIKLNAQIKLMNRH